MFRALAWPWHSRARAQAFIGVLLIIWAIYVANVAPEERLTIEYQTTEVQK